MKIHPKRARILFVDHIAVLGGGELALLALVRELDRTRFEPIVLLFSEGPLAEEIRSLAETHILPLPEELLKAKRGSGQLSVLLWHQGTQLLRFLYDLCQKMSDIRPDIVHTNSLKANLLGGLAARTLRIPLIWHVRDRIDQDYLPRIAVLGLRTLSRWIPDFLIANSAATLATLHLSENSRAVVISSGIDLQPFVQAAQGTETLPQAISAHAPIRIGIIGRICPWKGQDVFLRAAALVHDSYPKAQFFIVGAPLFGEEDYEGELRALADTLRINENLTSMGFRRDMPQVIADLHIIVHASTIPEPFGQVIVQGMAAGKPVVASEGGGPSEIIESGKTGLLCRRGDPSALAAAILSLLSAPEHAQQIALQGQRRVESRYSAKTTTSSVEKLYDEIVFGNL
jgi:glycosyltransferase involved in cell wall biosynthesis